MDMDIKGPKSQLSFHSRSFLIDQDTKQVKIKDQKPKEDSDDWPQEEVVRKPAAIAIKPKIVIKKKAIVDLDDDLDFEQKIETNIKEEQKPL